MKSASLAIEPLMLAERDREYLKQLRRNRWVGKCEMGSPDINDAIVSSDVKCQASSCLFYRDAEEKLMADVEGWEVGTFYGHKVYKVSHFDSTY